MELERKLRGSFKKDLVNAGHYFVPCGTLNSILQFNAIKEHLKKHKLEEDIVRRVCDNYRKIFAILVLLGKEEIVLKFVKDNIKDECLPFTLVEEAPTKQGDSVPYLDNLSYLDRKNFEDFQWYMLAPRFERGEDGKVPRLILPDRTIFPWMSYGKEISGGYSRVRRVEIHPEHHNLGKSNAFAVKELLHTKEKDGITQAIFNKEVDASKMLQEYDGLVTLVATYCYKGGYYLLFQWASGGNLREFWAQEPPTGPDIKRWVGEQCVRLASGLAKIHDCSAATKDGQKDCGLHGDIKPENILCFKDPSIKFGDLRISDFGLTDFHSKMTKSQIHPHRPHSPTYAAPEIALGKPLSRRYDIWGLGCVFLEIIVWLILGKEALKEFEDLRFDEQDQGPSKQDNFFKIQTGHETAGGRTARVKDSVRNQIRELQRHPSRCEYLSEFLSYIGDHMLVVDKDNRAESSELCRKLSEMQEKYRDQSYISQTTESEIESRVQRSDSPRIMSPSAQDGVQGEVEHATTHDTGSSESEANQDSSLVVRTNSKWYCSGFWTCCRKNT